MVDDVLTVLQRLNRRIGREAARCEKAGKDGSASTQFRDRCWYEANVLRMAQSFVTAEIRKAKGNK
jgi:hypothetical protein